MKCFWLTLVIVLQLSYPIYSQIQKQHILFERTVTLQIDTALIIYDLPDSFLIKNSEQVRLDNLQLKRNSDYNINYTKGKISFLRNIPYGKKVQIYYQFLPIQLQQSFFHRQLILFQPEDSTKSTTEKLSTTHRKPPQVASTLSQNGSIVRGITVGTNRGLTLESGLRLQISGKIADQWEVIAALTDQNTPIQPEGNTQTLQEIDKVFVQLKSDRFQAVLGDYYLTFEGTEFSSYNRKLQGVMGTADLGKNKFTLSGAVSKGKFATNQFLGQEGNQGPYQLKGNRGEIDIIVLAGTEKVWIDGVLMTRGENNDYIIEYSNGQITFTRNRLITADSRITVDFQYSDQKFQRGLYGADFATRLLNDKFKVGVRLIREVDDKENPLDYSLTEENLERLRQAGNDPDSAYISGVRYVGPEKGNYIEVDSAGVKFYRYIGTNAGDHNVAFSYVGQNVGTYKMISYGNYQYVFSDSGSYRPIIFLTPPESHDMVDLELAFHPRQNFQINTELAISRLDRNLYSTKDDENNTGLAMSTQFGLKQQPVKLFENNFGKLNLNGKYRRVQDQFQFIDRAEEVEKNRKWDLTTATTQQEEIIEVNAGYSPSQQMNITGNLGENRRGDNFYSRRWELGSEISYKKIPQLRYRIESIESQQGNSNRVGNWIRQYGNGQYQFWKLKSVVNFLAESKKEIFQDILHQDSLKLGLRFFELGPSINLTDWRKMSFTVGLTQRHQEKFGNKGFSPESDALTQFVLWQLRDWKNLSLSLQYTHRERNYADSSIGTKLTDLADFSADYSPFNRAITTNWYYKLSNTQAARLERIYIKVEPGQGNYRYDEDLKEYVPDALTGDYILVVRATDEFIPVIELRASTTVKFKPGLFWKVTGGSNSLPKWKKWLSAITTETVLQIEEKTKHPDVWSIYRLNLSRFQQDSTTIFGATNFKQDLYWGRNRRNLSLRLRYINNSNLNNQYLEGGQRIKSERYEVRMIGQLSQKLSSQLDYQNRMEQKLYKTTERSDKNVHSNEIALDVSYRPRQSIELAIKTKWSYSENRVAHLLKVNYFALAPRLNYSFRGKGRLRVEIEFNQVKVNPKNAILPYEIVLDNRAGMNFRWIASFDYNVSRYLRASLNWNGHYEQYLAKPIYAVKAEMRAYF